MASLNLSAFFERIWGANWGIQPEQDLVDSDGEAAAAASGAAPSEAVRPSWSSMSPQKQDETLRRLLINLNQQSRDLSTVVDEHFPGIKGITQLVIDYCTDHTGNPDFPPFSAVAGTAHAVGSIRICEYNPFILGYEVAEKSERPLWVREREMEEVSDGKQHDPRTGRLIPRSVKPEEKLILPGSKGPHTYLFSRFGMITILDPRTGRDRRSCSLRSHEIKPGGYTPTITQGGFCVYPTPEYASRGHARVVGDLLVFGTIDPNGSLTELPHLQRKSCQSEETVVMGEHIAVFSRLNKTVTFVHPERPAFTIDGIRLMDIKDNISSVDLRIPEQAFTLSDVQYHDHKFYVFKRIEDPQSPHSYSLEIHDEETFIPYEGKPPVPAKTIYISKQDVSENEIHLTGVRGHVVTLKRLLKAETYTLDVNSKAVIKDKR